VVELDEELGLEHSLNLEHKDLEHKDLDYKLDLELELKHTLDLNHKLDLFGMCDKNAMHS
jgi:hypothetical protein